MNTLFLQMNQEDFIYFGSNSKKKGDMCFLIDRLNYQIPNQKLKKSLVV